MGTELGPRSIRKVEAGVPVGESQGQGCLSCEFKVQPGKKAGDKAACNVGPRSSQGGSPPTRTARRTRLYLQHHASENGMSSPLLERAGCGWGSGGRLVRADRACTKQRRFQRSLNCRGRFLTGPDPQAKG